MNNSLKNATHLSLLGTVVTVSSFTSWSLLLLWYSISCPYTPSVVLTCLVIVDLVSPVLSLLHKQLIQHSQFARLSVPRYWLSSLRLLHRVFFQIIRPDFDSTLHQPSLPLPFGKTVSYSDSLVFWIQTLAIWTPLSLPSQTRWRSCSWLFGLYLLCISGLVKQFCKCVILEMWYRTGLWLGLKDCDHRN